MTAEKRAGPWGDTDATRLPPPPSLARPLAPPRPVSFLHSLPGIRANKHARKRLCVWGMTQLDATHQVVLLLVQLPRCPRRHPIYDDLIGDGRRDDRTKQAKTHLQKICGVVAQEKEESVMDVYYVPVVV